MLLDTNEHLLRFWLNFEDFKEIQPFVDAFERLFAVFRLLTVLIEFLVTGLDMYSSSSIIWSTYVKPIMLLADVISILFLTYTKSIYYFSIFCWRNTDGLPIIIMIDYYSILLFQFNRIIFCLKFRLDILKEQIYYKFIKIVSH